MSSISGNLQALNARIHEAAVTSARLIAVSKFQPEASVREALRAGQRVFGENRVQEAKTKFATIRHDYPDLELHLIGSLQTNKAEEAVKLFDVIQTIDRPNLAEAVAKAIKKTGKHPRLYVEINIGNEPQKAGVAPDNLDEFLAFCRDQCGLPISGLMCIPPHDAPPEPFFDQMRELAARASLPNLSMGMSSDFEAALRHGATEVRVGTAIFGERPQSVQQ